MAEFKLGRIRFVYKSDWVTSTTYYKDDIVRYGGNTYVCIGGHTAAADFYTDLSAYWNKITDGQQWKGDWDNAQLYKINDVVQYGGNLYIANEGHTSADNSDAVNTTFTVTVAAKSGGGGNAFYIDGTEAPVLQIVPGAVNTFNLDNATNATHPFLLSTSSDGTLAGGLLYDPSSVTYQLDGATVDVTAYIAGFQAATTRRLILDLTGTFDEPLHYYCNAHTGMGNSIIITANSLETDSTKWDLYGEGFAYKNEWTIATYYKTNDIVKYNGIQYLCVTPHTSSGTVAEGLEFDQSKWNEFTQGFDWKGDWTAEARYRRNDIVKYGGQIYVCNTGHTAAATNALGLENDQSKWDYFHKGIEYKGEWTQGTRYKVNDIVKSGGGTWICTAYHTATGATLRSQESNWAEFVDGLEFEDTWNNDTEYNAGDFITYGGYGYVAVINNRGEVPTENLGTWDLFTSGFNHRGEYGDDSSNQDYRTGDVISLGGYTYLCIQDSNGNRPPNTTYWMRLNQGFYWKDAWTDSTYYDLGDVVRYSDSSYICVLSHTSDETVAQNRPDQDLDGSEWNLMSGGPESGTLTTDGDIVYFAGAGPARLPIGQTGQVLKVNAAGNAPEWDFLGSVPNVVYVDSNAGSDTPPPTYGITLDQPFKTIRYALEQIDMGTNRRNSSYLLDLNRSFIQAEAVEWVDYQVTNTVSPFTGSFTYDKTVWRVLVGRIVDALIYDLRHNGNKGIRDLTLEIFDDSTISGKETEFNAMLTYVIETLIDDAIYPNLDPATNFQTANSVGSPITQQKPTGYDQSTEEVDAQSFTETKIAVLSSAITAGNTTSTEAEYIPNNTCYVKTGQFEEHLPMIIPERTAVVGDELRSTRIKPSPAVTSASDTPKSLAAIARIEAIISDIVQNISITKSTGNSDTQVTTRPAGTSAVGTVAADLFRQIYDYIDFRINGASGDSTTPLTAGTNTPQTSTDYTYSREVIEANRDFIIAEVHAYIAVTYPSYSYSLAACARDVGTYLDAVKYDLIYTGNYKSLLAARYYANSVEGSGTEDMFYMRNATGLRNCTLADLTGVLGSANSYGTKRPTAGAYTSLDPGWGPDDDRVWISGKSPYIQNVTTFGTACVGCKVDGDLHNGGNDSIVANDFTQVLSDGIGYWVTNLGRAELVSVFTYYNHIGYLSENGGKIRATNGNNSYGAFGSVAEGVDDTEIPIDAKVNNQYSEAVVDSVFTDGNNILVLEFLNAGTGYTAGATTTNIAGEGFGAAISASNVVDGGVMEVRLLDTDVNADGTFDTGGAGYIEASNAAQGGNATQITISNTDIRLSSQYIGMAIFIIAGTGAGQYGYIATYNSGTKIATVNKMSDGSAGWDHLVPGTAIETELDGSTTYSIEPRLSFAAPASGLYADTTKGRVVLDADKVAKFKIWDPGNGYTVAPVLTITDPNNTIEVPFQVRIGDGVVTQPTWSNRGSAYVTAESTISGDGYADIFQPGEFVQVQNMTVEPKAGSNVVFDHLPNKVFKLVTVRSLTGSAPNLEAQLQISPKLEINEAPSHLQDLEMRIRYSQVRLTGHDFLDIGTGGFTTTNYPGVPSIAPDATKETNDFGGGRVFYTSTDQDGNFRVGELFSVEQSTGTATLNADAFNISGLQELSLGELGLGSAGATITEFSTDGTFTADSDSIVPTQKAIRTYITSQIGGGAATLNVNSITAGVVRITSDTIDTTNGAQININAKLNFKRGVNGAPVAMNYLLGS